MPKINEHMRDLYTRLAEAGYDRPFIRRCILPDWWEDEMAGVPANRALAEGLIAATLGYRVSDLRDPAIPLRKPAPGGFRLKRRKDTKPAELAPHIHFAMRVAALLAKALPSLPAFRPLPDANAIRRQILERCSHVDLPSLLEHAWESGIAVLHLPDAPAQSRRFDGLALFIADRPAIVLGSRREGQPWLAFHLAHELGHIHLGHVTPESAPIADGSLDANSTDGAEGEADAFALGLLASAETPPAFPPTLRADALAQMASLQGELSRIDPGILALVHGRRWGRWGVAQEALNILGLSSGAPAMLRASLRRRLGEDVSEHIERIASLQDAA